MKYFLFIFVALSSFGAHAGFFTASFQEPISIPSIDGSREAAKIYLPLQYRQDQTWPVLLLLHGYAGDGDFIDAYFGLSDEVSRRGYILVVPNGKVDRDGRHFWNATEACCDFDHSQSDDVGYLLALLTKVRSSYRVDAKRVVVLGHSNGGFMAHRLACEGHSPVTAIVSFAGVAFLNPQDCHATHPVSVLQIHAVDDDTIHFEGDKVGYPKLAPYPGAQATIDQWLARNRCATKMTVGVPLSLTMTAGAHDTETDSWRGCAGGSEVRLWKIRASDSILHFPHTPLLTDQFTESILDFALQPRSASGG